MRPNVVVQSRRSAEVTRAVAALEWFIARMNDSMRAQLIDIHERSWAMAALKGVLWDLGTGELLGYRFLKKRCL